MRRASGISSSSDHIFENGRQDGRCMPENAFPQSADTRRERREAEKHQNTDSRHVCSAVLMAVLFYWLFRPSLGVTRDMMPTKWSDFNFWRQTIQQIQNNLELLLQTKKTSLDLLVLRPFFSCLKYCVMAWLLYAVGYRWEKNAGTAEVLAGILLSWILLLGVICFLGDSGLYLAGEKRIWFWACFWLTGGYAADRMHAF